MPEKETDKSVDADQCKMDSGLVIAMNEQISSFLLSAAKEPNLSADLKELASELSLEKSISYRSLRVIWFNSSPSTRPPLRRLFSSSEFVLQSPKPREKVRISEKQVNPQLTVL